MSSHEGVGAEKPRPTTFLGRCADAIEGFVTPAYRWIGYAGALVLAALVSMMLYQVLARKVFGSPIQGSGDLIEVGMLLLTFGAMGIEHLGHEKMTVDVLAKKLPRKVQDYIAPVIYLLGVFVLCIAVWQLVKYGIKLQDRGETSRGTLKIVKYPFAYIAAFGVLTLVPIYLSRFLRAVDGLFGSSSHEKEVAR